MIDPDLVIDAVVSAFQSIHEVTAALGTPDPSLPPPWSDSLIVGHKYFSGEENSLARSLEMMPAPSILVAYMDMLGGNFSGEQVWKHRLEVYLRPKNKIADAAGIACSAPHLWWLLMRKPVTSISPGTLDFRTIRIMSGMNPCDAMPHMIHHTTQTGEDFFCGQIVLPEWGDQ